MLGGIQALQEAYDFILSNFCGAIVSVNTEVAMESKKLLKKDEFVASSMIGCGQNNHAPDLLNFVLIFAGEDFQFDQGPYHQHTSPVFFVE